MGLSILLMSSTSQKMTPCSIMGWVLPSTQLSNIRRLGQSGLEVAKMSPIKKEACLVRIHVGFTIN